MKLQVTDTSYHNGQFDWQIFKDAGVQGVVLKASDGFFMPNDWSATSWDWHTDPSFIAYWKYVKDMFSWRMAYHFVRVDDEKAKYFGRPTSSEQIQYFYDLVTEQGLDWNDYICLDIEQIDEELSYLDKQKVANRVQNVIRKTHDLFKRKPIIYSGAWWWEKYHKYFDTDFINEYKFWLSHYWDINEQNEIVDYGYKFVGLKNAVYYKDFTYAYCRVPTIDSVPTIKPENVILWQYSARGKLEGIAKKFDINVILKDESLWNEERGEAPVIIEPEPEPEPEPIPPIEPEPEEPPTEEPPVEEPPVEPEPEPEEPVEEPTEPPVQPPEPPDSTETPDPVYLGLLVILRAIVAFFRRVFSRR